MKKPSFNEALDAILNEDPRYDREAYFFLRSALDFTIKLLSKPVEGPARHVTGGELLDGIRQYALHEFGPLTKTVLNEWGIHRCEDFGEIVFTLVNKGVLGKSDHDRKEDFAGGYEFETAFRKPFRPKQLSEIIPPSSSKN